MKPSHNGVTGLIAKLAGLVFIVCMAAAVAGLAKFLYFPSSEENFGAAPPVETYVTPEGQRRWTSHFHIADRQLPEAANAASMCIQCHGYYAHRTSEQLRSFYNMHSYYMACETCHIRMEVPEKPVMAWFDWTTEKQVRRPGAGKSLYSARLVPIRADMRLDAFDRQDLAREYMLRKDALSDAEKKKREHELMGHLSKNAVACEDCHRKDGYLDFFRLGYDAQRTAMLQNPDIMQLIKGYKKFFIPTMFDPRKETNGS